MTDPYRSADYEPGSQEQRYPVADTEVFPTSEIDVSSTATRQFPASEDGRTRQFPIAADDQQSRRPPSPARRPSTAGSPSAPVQRPSTPVRRPQSRRSGPHPVPHRPLGPEPLAHEGGLPYGRPPAPVSPPPQPAAPQQFAAQRPVPQQYVPQHLAVPQQFAPGPYQRAMPGHMPMPGHSPMSIPMQQPYLYSPHPLQQTVIVNNSGRRVNHGLHLVLTIITFGFWLPIWMILAIANS